MGGVGGGEFQIPNIKNLIGVILRYPISCGVNFSNWIGSEY